MGTVFTAAEAIGSGQTYWQLSAAVRRQQLGRPWRGIYLTNLTADWLEKLAAVVHASGGVISHGAAARLHGLWGFESDTIEITLPPGRRFSRPGVRAHQSQTGELSAHSLPVTSLARTLIDLAGVVDELALANALESAWCQDRHLLEELDRRLGGSMRGRRGIRRLRCLVDDARRRGRPLESPLEVRLWRLLHAWKLPLPLAGVQVNDGCSKSFRFDFLYPSCSLAIETDGYRWHRTPEIFVSDCRRQSRAAALGYRVMRLTWADLDDPGPVRERLLAALGPPAPHTTRSGTLVPWPSSPTGFTTPGRASTISFTGVRSAPSG
jgi:very-short-patch-repair endonuclease